MVKLEGYVAMSTDESKMLRMTIWFCAGVFLVACVFSITIVIDALKTPEQKPETSAQTEKTEKQPETHAAPVQPAQQRASAPEFVTDYQEIRAMEIAVETQVEKMMEYAANNPDSEDALSAEQIAIIKKEGVLVQ